MRSALFHKLPFLLLLTAIAHCQGPPPQHVNPHTQIRWPANCHGPNMVYNYVSNQCVTTPDVTNLTPGPPAICPNAPGGGLTSAGCTLEPVQVHWPGSCASGVYSPAANACVPTGSAGNPAAPMGSGQMNAGGVFAPIPGFTNDANYGWKTAGGMQYARGYQSGGGWNGIAGATANGQVVMSDPGYLVQTTASMVSNSNVITVANPAGIVAGQWVAGNVQAGSQVGSVAGNNVTLSGYPLSTNPSALVSFFENPYRNVIPYTQNLPNATQTEFIDHKLGQEAVLKRDPPWNIYTSRNDFNVEGCFSTKRNTWYGTGGIGNNGLAAAGSNETCHVLFSWFGAPSTNYGTTSSKGPSNWGVSVALNVSDTASEQGIGEGLGGTHVKSGIGDGPDSYFYYADYLGSVSGSDEGQGGPFVGGGEASTTFTATVSTGGGGTGANACTSGSTGNACLLSTTCISDCSTTPSLFSGGPGDGRYMVDKANPVAFNMISRTAPLGTTLPGTITIDATVPVSTFWGTLAGDASTPAGVNSQSIPFSNGTTDMTFSVNSGTLQGAANTGSPQVGDLVCFGWASHEQARIKSVNSGSFPGPWSITVPLRMPHTSGSWMLSNGTCGSYIDFAANDVLPAESGVGVPLHYPFESIGSTGPNTLVYTFFHTNGVNTNNMGAFPLGRVTSPFGVANGTTITNSGGVVTIGNIRYAALPWFFYYPVITITGAANSAYNGQCLNTVPDAIGQLTCTQASSLGQSSTTATASTTVSLGTSGYGNTAGVLWQGAEVLDILDYSETNCAATNAKHAPCFDSKNFTLEPNAAPWANGDAVEEPHHYAAQIIAGKNTFEYFNPMVASGTDGQRFQLAGPAICCGTNGSPTGNWSAFAINNANSANLYEGHGGGTLTPPGGIDVGGGGPYNYGLFMDHAPEPGGAGIYGGFVVGVGCPLTPLACLDRNFTYSLFNLATNNNQNGAQIVYSPFNNEIMFGNPATSNAMTWNGDMNGILMRDNLRFSAVAPPALTLTPSLAGGKAPDGSYCYYILPRNLAGFSPPPAETCTSIAAISITGNITNGSTTVSAITPTAGLSTALIVGAAISGAGIPAGATVVSYFGGATTMVISAAATATTTGIAITLDSVGGNGGSVKLTWARASGATSYYVCGRTTGSELQMGTLAGVDSTFYVDTYGVTPTSSCTFNSGQPMPNGGVDQAGQIGVNSLGTTFESTIKAPAGLAASVSHTLPSVSGTLALTSQTTPVRAGTWTVTASTSVAVTFSVPFVTTPASCAITPTGDPTAVGAIWMSGLTVTGMTVNVHTSGTISGTYQCVGGNTLLLREVLTGNRLREATTPQ